jgi:hypothetical protein
MTSTLPNRTTKPERKRWASSRRKISVLVTATISERTTNAIDALVRPPTLSVMPELAEIRDRLVAGTITPAQARAEVERRIPGFAEQIDTAKAQLDAMGDQDR